MKKNLFTTSGSVATRSSSSRLRRHSMFRIFFTLTLLCVFAQGTWAGVGHSKGEWVGSTTENLDSASYAYGDLIIRSIMESKDSIYPGFEYNKENLAKLIRGLEENLAYMKYSQDSIKKISFSLGAMQGVFFSDRVQFEREAIPYDCILAGLRKVINHELTLPQDTIKVLEYMKSLPENIKPTDLPSEDKCQFFTGYGIMKGLQPGLQEYIHETTGKNEDDTPADYEAFAAGFAMMVNLVSLEAKQQSEQGPYDYGVAISSSLIMQPLPFHFSEADFLDGCRAAAGLNKRIITVEESERMISMVFPEREAPFVIQESHPDTIPQ